MKLTSEQLDGMKDVDINSKRVVYTDSNGIRLYCQIFDDGTLGIPFLYLGEDNIDYEVESKEENKCYVEYDIQKDRTWHGQYYCGMHGVWFRDDDDEEIELCPAGEEYIRGYSDCRKEK